MKRFSIAVFCLVSAYLSAQEQQPEPIETDRPDQTETPSLVPKGMFQVETGFAFEKIDATSETITTPSVLWKYGINDNFELRLITEFSSETAADGKMSGLKPVLVGFKAKISEENGIVPKTAFTGHMLLPNFASEDFKADYYAAEFRFSMQHTLSDKIDLGYNFGAEWNGETPEPTFIYTLTTAYSFTDKFSAFIELYGFAPQNDTADHRFDGGLTYLLSNNFMIDVSGGFGITENAPAYFASAGFSFRI